MAVLDALAPRPGGAIRQWRLDSSSGSRFDPSISFESDDLGRRFGDSWPFSD